MANVIYNSFKATMMAGNIDLDTNTIMCALVTSVYVPNMDTEHVWANISANEVAGTAYVAGGTALVTPSVVIDDTNDKGVFDATDITWAVSTIAAGGAVLYGAASSALICYFDFGGEKKSGTGNFIIQWSGSGIMNLA